MTNLDMTTAVRTFHDNGRLDEAELAAPRSLPGTAAGPSNRPARRSATSPPSSRAKGQAWPTSCTGPSPCRRHAFDESSPPLLLETSQRSPVQTCQDAFAGQHRDRHDTLPLGRHHRQGHSRRPQRDPGVDVEVLAGQSDHRGDQLGQPLAAGVGGVVVDLAGDRGQQRMGARRVVAPALIGTGRARPVPGGWALRSNMSSRNGSLSSALPARCSPGPAARVTARRCCETPNP